MTLVVVTNTVVNPNILSKARDTRSLRAFDGILLFSIVLVASWIRVQGIEHLPAGQFTETDGYFYYWQGQLILEHGELPPRDMNRWLPLGRDLRQTLNLYGYVLAYTYKTIAWISSNISLYDVTLYMPVLCFSVGLSVLCLFLYRMKGIFFSSIVGVLLATLPGSIERSAAGFGDRDAWCLMLGTLAVITYLTSLQAEHPRSHFFWTLVSGFIVFLGGISWEGFGVFLSIILAVEVWRFLTNKIEEGLGYYLLWVLIFAPTLYLGFPAYRSGYGFAKHLAAFLLIPPIALLGIRSLRYLLLAKVERLRPHARTLALVLTLLTTIFVLVYVFTQLDTFADTTVPLSQNALMQAMTELKAPHYGYWVARYGSVFIVGSLGFVIMPLHLWKKQGILLSIPLTFFTISTFFRQPLDKIWGDTFGNIFFGIALVGCIITFTALAWRRKTKVPYETVFIAFTVWYLMWVALARDAKRYDFFIGIALAFGSAALILWFALLLSEKLWHSGYVTENFRENFKLTVLKKGVVTILLFMLMCLPINKAHTYRAIYAAKEMRNPLPGYTRVNAAFHWIKTFLVKKSTAETDIPVVAAHWAYGSQLNVLADVKTIIDQDTYLQHWILLYNKHVHEAKDEHEALTFLKTHGATHIMLTKKDPKSTLLRGQLSKAFVPVYPKMKFVEASVKVWEIHYPPNIKTDRKYLQTGFPEVDTKLQR